MTIPTPTVNPAAVEHPPLPGGLPDPATLASLANAFFSALPGGKSGVSAPVVASPDVSAGSGATGGLPSALPAAAPILASVSNPAPAGSPLAGCCDVASIQRLAAREANITKREPSSC